MTLLSGRYELGDLLGRGGMADVYAAGDHLLGRQVAVKMLRDSAGSATDRDRFTHEARTLAGLSHRGLVTVLDAGLTGVHDDQPFLVMELVHGPSLAQALGHGPLDLVRTTSICAQVADALAYAHAAGVVHRDVKPGNVLLRTDGAVKLADFGIARLLGDTVRHTRTGHAIGTAAYLSPEQVTGDDVTGAADVYALGLVLLESLTGEREYAGPPTEAALARLTRPPVVRESLPPHLGDLIGRMTALEPLERPSAAQAARDLRRPTSPPPPPRLSDHTRVRMPAAPVAAPTPAGTLGTRLGSVPPDVWGVAVALVVLTLLLVAAALAG